MKYSREFDITIAGFLILFIIYAIVKTIKFLIGGY